MKILLKILSATFVACLCLGSHSFAYELPGIKGKAPAPAPKVQILAPIQISEIDYDAHYRQIYGEVSLKPGVYRIINLNSQNCLGTYSAGSGFLGFKLSQQNCYFGTPPEMALIPTIEGKFTIRREHFNGINLPMKYCATVARNVLIGPSDIDFVNCDLPLNSSEWGQAGIEDQKFRFASVGNGGFEIRTNDEKCFAVRDASKEHGAGVIKWDCTGGADQRWKPEFVRPISTPSEIEALGNKYWYLRGNSFFLARPVFNISYTGNPIRKISSPNDNGKQCAVACLDEAMCKGFSWRPKHVDNSFGTQSSCTLYSGITMMNNVADGTLSGIIKR